MLITACALAALAAPTAPAVVATPEPAGAGKIAWFDGTYDEALAEAKNSKRLVFIDFYTTWCPPCKKLNAETFVDDSVVAEMKDIVCLSIDAESEIGLPLAKKYNVTAYPTLMFLEHDGTPRDMFRGFLPAKEWNKEVARIKRNEGTITALRKEVDAEGADPELRITLAEKLNDVGDRAGFEAQLAKLEKQNPELAGSSRVRRLLFEMALAPLQTELDSKPLREFLATEKNPEILYDGWTWIQRAASYQHQTASREGESEKAAKYAKEAYDALKKAWAHAPEANLAEAGNYIAWTIYELNEELGQEHMAFAVKVAEKAVAALSDDARAEQRAAILDTLACVQFASGDRASAIETIKRCIELEPKNEVWQKRLDEFTTEV